MSTTEARTLVLGLMLSSSSSCSSHRQVVVIRFQTSDASDYLRAKTLIILRFSTFSHFSVYTLVYQNLVTFHSRNCDFYNNIFNRIYNKILTRDWFSARLFAT